MHLIRIRDAGKVYSCEDCIKILSKMFYSSLEIMCGFDLCHYISNAGNKSVATKTLGDGTTYIFEANL